MINKIIRSPERRILWDPFGDLDGFFDNVLRPARAGNPEQGQALAPAIDVTEKDDAYLVKADLPGVRKEDMDISIKDGVLTINAQTKYEHDEEKDGRLVRQERRYGRYVRTMRLDGQIDESKVDAQYKDGVLNLRLPKAEEIKPKKIDVTVV